MDLHGTRIGSAVAGGLSERGGSIPKGISLPWSGVSDAKLGSNTPKHTGRCAADCIRFAVPADPTLWTLNSSLAVWHFRVLGGSWSALGSSWRVLGHLLGASWRVLGSWRPLGGVLEGPWSDFGGHQSYLGDVLDGLEAILEALWELLGSKSEPKGRLMGVQEGPKSTS